jgi:hypothetical protein
MKNLTWLANSRSSMKSFPANVQDDIGHATYAVWQRLKQLRSEVKHA